MYRLVSLYDSEKNCVTVKGTIQVGKSTVTLGTKNLFADVNYDESITFGTNRTTYYSDEFTAFINDVKANIQSQFIFDSSNDEDGCIDALIFGNGKLKVESIYGKNNLCIMLEVTPTNRNLLVDDLIFLQKTLDKHAMETIDDYRLLGRVPGEEDDDDNDDNNNEENGGKEEI